MGKTILYMHAGSKNHGCEAIVNSLCRMLGKEKEDILLVTFREKEDLSYSLQNLCSIVEERSFSKHKLAHLFYYVYRMVTKDANSFMRFRYRDVLKVNADVAVSIGGDNYCYDMMLNDLFLTNNVFNEKGIKTVLLGCSIEPELLNRADIKTDLSKYSDIIARESLTYDALKESFGENGPRIYCVPDPAFTLPFNERPLPESFIEKNTVGINISPMIMDNETKSGIAMDAYKSLIKYILEKTDMNVALIPHVVWDFNDDRKPIETLYQFFSKEGYSSRIVKIPDDDAESLKGYIRRCRFFIGARTHSTIAAYSSKVPTIVVGYSVKAKGIAKDIFEGYDISKLVLPVQSLQDDSQLVNAFLWLMEHEEEMKSYLDKVIPDYCERALESGRIIQKG